MIARPYVRTAAALGVAALVLTLTGCGSTARETRYTRRGQEYLAQGEYAKARLEFRNALQIAPNNADLRYYNGLADEKLGNIREAVQFYRSAIDLNHDQVAARASLGRLFASAGLSKDALDQIDPGLKTHPDYAPLLVVHAIVMQQKKDTAQALKDAQRAAQVDPGSEEAVATLAGLEMHSGQPEAALQLVQDALKRRPDSVDLRGVLARVYGDRNDVAGVERTLQGLMQLRPKSDEYPVELARLYAKTNRTAQAESTLRGAMTRMPEDDALKRALIEFLWVQRGHEVAESEFRRMIAAAPSDLGLSLSLAELYQEGGKVAAAEAEYRRLIDSDTKGAVGMQARDRLAEIDITRNDFAGARKLVTDVLEQNPADSEALSMRATEELSEGATQAAITDLRRILRDQPYAVRVLDELARAYVADGDPQLAEVTARRAVELDPSNVPARIALAQVLLAADKPDESRTIAVELEKTRPDDTAVLDLVYRSSLELNDLAAARNAAAELVRLRPDWPVGLVYLGTVAERAGQAAEALNDYSQALVVQPRAVEPLNAMVRLLERTRRYAEAEQLLDERARKYPNSAVEEGLKGEVLLAEGHRTADAQAAFKQAIAREPSWWPCYRGLALLALERGGPGAAEPILRDAEKRAALTESQRLELAVLLSTVGQQEEAITQYETALRLNPKSRAAAASLALLLVSFRTDDLSLSRAAALVRPFSDSQDWRLQDAYGWVMFKNGNLTEALTPLQKAAAQHPDAPQVRFHLGMAQLKAGNDNVAESNLAAALQGGESFFGRDEARAVLAHLRSIKSHG